jgi:dinuclear metal center YbgI/SA1388 family protein
LKIKDIIAPLEEFAPLRLQESYDNAGLLVGSPDSEVSSALLCVDATDEVLDEAEKIGAGLIISHHPIIFHPLKRFTGKGHVERIVERAIRSGIALYACHTNLDRTGMSRSLAEKLRLQNIEVLDPAEVEGGTGFGAVGDLAEPAGAIDFLRTVASTLGTGCVRYSTPCNKTVRRIALIAGSGGEGIEKAIEVGADVFLTADLRYDRFFAAEKRILVADIGHFESEFCAIDLMYEVISKKIATFALHKSENSHNPVNYLV